MCQKCVNACVNQICISLCACHYCCPIGNATYERDPSRSSRPSVTITNLETRTSNIQSTEMASNKYNRARGNSYADREIPDYSNQNTPTHTPKIPEDNISTMRSITKFSLNNDVKSDVEDMNIQNIGTLGSAETPVTEPPTPQINTPINNNEIKKNSTDDDDIEIVIEMKNDISHSLKINNDKSGSLKMTNDRSGSRKKRLSVIGDKIASLTTRKSDGDLLDVIKREIEIDKGYKSMDDMQTNHNKIDSTQL